MSEAFEQNYVLVHEHKHGDDIYPFTISAPLKSLPSVETLAKYLGINFEPEKEEFLTLRELGVIRPIPADALVRMHLVDRFPWLDEEEEVRPADNQVGALEELWKKLTS